MGQLFVVPSRREVYPDLPVRRLPIGSQLSPVARGEADFNEWHTVTIEIYNPDNDALLYRHAEPVDSGSILLPLTIVSGYIDHKFPCEAAGNVQGGFATSCTGVVTAAFGDCFRSGHADGHVLMATQCYSVGSKIDNGLSKENVSAHIFPIVAGTHVYTCVPLRVT